MTRICTVFWIMGMLLAVVTTAKGQVVSDSGAAEEKTKREQALDAAAYINHIEAPGAVPTRLDAWLSRYEESSGLFLWLEVEERVK